MSNNQSGVRVVTEIAIEMRNSIIVLAGERGWAETRQRWLERAARQAGISYRAARALFYLEEHEPGASVVERIRVAVQRRKDTEEATRVEFKQTVERLGFLVDRLATIDPDFHRQALRALRSTAPIARGEDRTMDRGKPD